MVIFAYIIFGFLSFGLGVTVAEDNPRYITYQERMLYSIIRYVIMTVLIGRVVGWW